MSYTLCLGNFLKICTSTMLLHIKKVQIKISTHGYWLLQNKLKYYAWNSIFTFNWTIKDEWELGCTDREIYIFIHNMKNNDKSQHIKLLVLYLVFKVKYYTVWRCITPVISNNALFHCSSQCEETLQEL